MPNLFGKKEEEEFDKKISAVQKKYSETNQFLFETWWEIINSESKRVKIPN